MFRFFTPACLPLAILATLFVFSGMVLAETAPEENAFVEELTKVSDSLHIVITKAIADKDTLALAGLITPKTGAVMPGNIVLNSGDKIIGNLPRLMQYFGGGVLTIKRNDVRTRDFNGREAGTCMITKKVADEKEVRWAGKYTFMYTRVDGKWTITSVFFVK